MTAFWCAMIAALMLLAWGTLFLFTLVIRNIKRIEARLDKLETQFDPGHLIPPSSGARTGDKPAPTPAPRGFI